MLVPRRRVRPGGTLREPPTERNECHMTVPGTAAIPDRARAVVIGGGVIGTSVAYHLGHMGMKDVLLLERDRLTSGTTWHAAGLMATFGSTSQTSTELRMYTRDLYARLEAETGLATGLKQCGLIELAIEPGRLEEYRRVAAFNRLCGVEVHEISPAEVAALFPLARVDDVLAGFYIPADGRVNPVDVTMALAKGARMRGARILEGVPVTGFAQCSGVVTGVRTPAGDIEAEYVVNCAGMWARQLGELAGVSIPLQAAEHYYLLTEPIEGVDSSWPVLEDPASYGYYREEGGGLMLGMFEPVCAPWRVGGIPQDFSFGELPPDWDRMGPYQANPEYRATRTVESLGLVYATHYPHRPTRTARGARLSPIHDRLAALRACFRDVSGWEGADWYAPDGVQPEVGELSWGRPHWFGYWEAEHHATRNGVIVMDMSFMAKFLVQGRDAARELERISANQVAAEPGRITYTQWLNERGTLEADLTVTRLDDEQFFVVASDTAHRHAETWMRRHFGDAHAFVTDVTSGYAQVNVQGPLSRDLMAAVTSADMSNDAFGFRTARYIDIGFARVLCIRITYLGELGYELHIPAEQAVAVYDRLVAAGEPLGLRHAGLKALSSLRMEKAYRDYGHDIDNTDTVLEAGLGFAVALDKPGGFIGREAVLAQKERGPLRRRLVQVLLKDPAPLLFHAEVVHRNGRPAGYIRSASYGFTVGGAVGLAMIDAGEPIDQKYLDSGEWTVQIGDAVYPARASLRPLYDPASKRVQI